MKLRRIAVIAALSALALGTGAYAFQRVADWGNPQAGNQRGRVFVVAARV